MPSSGHPTSVPSGNPSESVPSYDRFGCGVRVMLVSQNHPDSLRTNGGKRLRQSSVSAAHLSTSAQQPKTTPKADAAPIVMIAAMWQISEVVCLDRFIAVPIVRCHSVVGFATRQYIRRTVEKGVEFHPGWSANQQTR